MTNNVNYYIMDTPFTKINLTMFMTYIMLLACKFQSPHLKKYKILQHIFKINRILGAITFNTSAAIMLPWESVRVLYPHASKHLINTTTKKYNISRKVFEFINFAIHIFPVMYLVSVRKHWSRYSHDIRTVMLSLFIHTAWIHYVPKHYNLNRVYMFGDKILDNSQWLRLWMLAIIGHFLSFGYYSVVK